tara:strand:+ start:2259 stop:2423 length:165 start_codon:yes stop_codon:yes gene_type:complete
MSKKLKALTKQQMSTLKKHSVHHSTKHISMMKDQMRKGMSFSKAHTMAQAKVGT